MIEVSEMVDLSGEIGRLQAYRIGIDGFGGAGKTTLAHELGKTMDRMGGVAIVCMDDFVDTSKYDTQTWDRGIFDRDRLEQEILLPSQLRKPLRYYSSRTKEEINVPEYRYLVVEGITACHPDIIEYFDLSIWVAGSLQKSIHRRVARDMPDHVKKHLNKWVFNDYEYALHYPPAERVDIIFDADGPKQPLIKEHERDAYGRVTWWQEMTHSRA